MKRNTIIYILIFLVAAVASFFYFEKKDAPGVTVDDSLPRQEGLPEAVENKRQAIYEAAIEQDYEKIAAEADPNLNYSFGGEAEGGFAGYLETSKTNGNDPFEIIPTVLKLPYAFENNIYVWPYQFYKDPGEWTEEDINSLRTFLDDEMIESFKSFGGYLYYRLGITPDGRWIFYLAGD